MLVAQKREVKNVYYDRTDTCTFAYGTNGLKNGLCICKDRNDATNYYTFFCVNDSLEGPFKIYHENKLLTEYNYKKNKLEGKATSYYQNGRKSSILNYMSGQLNGFAVFYYENGNIQCEINYDNVNKDSVFYNKVYTNKGLITYEGFYNFLKYGSDSLNYRRGGTFYFYKSMLSKKVTVTRTYNEGGTSLHETLFNDDGICIEEGNYLITPFGPKKEGIYKTYYDTGNLKQSIMYQKNKMNGKMEYYYPNKQLKFSIAIENDRANGEYVEYLDDGTLLLDFIFRKGAIVQRIKGQKTDQAQKFIKY